MAKNIILFGAGASYGSDNIGTPPLVNNLFNELTKFNPQGWGRLSNNYSFDFQNDFEQGMIKIANERPHDISILQRVMAAYFFNFQPRNTNLYYRLATRIKNSTWNGALATLNYERLLEISLRAAKLQPNIDIPSNTQIELKLPHGCCHLFCENVRGDANAVSFAGMNVHINGEIKVISSLNEFQHRIIQDACPPVMSYFEPQKRSTSGQAFLEGQRNRLKSLIETALKVIVIGIKIRSHDTHIWGPISNSNASFIYCSGSNEQANFKQWVNQYRNNKNNIFINGFWNEKFDEILNIAGL